MVRQITKQIQGWSIQVESRAFILQGLSSRPNPGLIIRAAWKIGFKPLQTIQGCRMIRPAGSGPKGWIKLG